MERVTRNSRATSLDVLAVVAMLAIAAGGTCAEVQEAESATPFGTDTEQADHKSDLLRAESGKYAHELDRISGVEGELPPEAAHGVARLRLAAADLRRLLARAEELERLSSGPQPDEALARAFSLGAQLSTLEHEMVEAAAMDTSDERDARLAKLRTKADGVRAEWHRTKAAAAGIGSAPRGLLPSRELAIIGVEHRDAQHLVDLIESFLPRGSEIVADDGTNSIVLFTTAPGLELSRRIIHELDLPLPREVWIPYAPSRRRSSITGPLYDYEVSRAVIEEAETETREQAPKAYERTTGTIVEKRDSSILILPDGFETPREWQLPQVLDDDGDWRIGESIRQALDGVDEGDGVVVEWWQAEDVRYVEGLAPIRASDDSD